MDDDDFERRASEGGAGVPATLLLGARHDGTAAGAGFPHPDYLSHVPQSLPSGKIIVHNRVRPTRRLGSRGFRAWFAEPSSEFEACPCKWAPELGVHYRVAGVRPFGGR